MLTYQIKYSLFKTQSKSLSPPLLVQRKAISTEIYSKPTWAEQVNKVPGKLEAVKEIGFGWYLVQLLGPIGLED